MAPKDPFRKSLAEILGLRKQTINHPLHNPDTELGDTLYEDQLQQHNYVLYEENVPAPLNDVEPGSLVVITHDGMSARWINNRVYVRRDVLEKQNKTPKARS